MVEKSAERFFTYLELINMCEKGHLSCIMWLSMLMQNFRKLFQAFLELKPNNGKIWAPHKFSTKILEKIVQTKKKNFFNNVP